MNKKGNTPITAFLMFIMFIIVYVLFLAQFIEQAGQTYIINNSPSGVILFFYNQLGTILLFIAIIAFISFLSWGSK